MAGDALESSDSWSRLTRGQQGIVRSLRAHEEEIVPTEEGRRPADIYVGDARYAAERDRLFRRVWVPLTVSARVPTSGTALPHAGYGVPLLVARDRDGVAHVFVNACRHRGAKVIEGCEAVTAGRFVCPYHGWTYSLDGRLLGVARPETFPTLKKDELGLVTLPSMERGGFIWVALDPAAAPVSVAGSGELFDDLEALDLHRWHLYGHRQYDLQANWKLVLEPFLENYHVARLHKDSVAKMFPDVSTLQEPLGPHVRQASGRANFSPSLLEGGVDNLHKYVTFAYLGFPNAIVVTSPYYTSVMILAPQSAGRTIVDYHMLVPAPADNPKAEDLYRRSYEMIDRVFGGEDFRAAQLAHEGLASRAVPEVRFGGMEKLVIRFHESVEAFLSS